MMHRPLPLILALMAPLAGPLQADEFRYDHQSVAPATYFAALSNLANAVMFSGLGEPLVISPYERDDWLRRAGYVARPSMPDLAMVGPLYAGGVPHLRASADFSRLETLAWAPAGFDRRLEPAAQAWALIKITSPEFHLQFHDLPENRLAALMMVPQARSQARVLAERLLNDKGLFVARDAEGRFASPRPGDQAVVLWAVANLMLAGTSPREDYWHAAYRDLTDADDYRALAHTALRAVEALAPRQPGDQALAIEALGRFALATDSERLRQRALALARQNAEALLRQAGTGLEGLALSIYGLTEAGRLLGDETYRHAAIERFVAHLLPLWNARLDLFHAPAQTQPLVLTPYRVAALVAALNSMRWYADEATGKLARALYPRFFEAAVVRSGLLQASPLPLVSPPYRQQRPDAHFAHPVLADAVKSATAPVFAAEVRFARGAWRVSDPRFRTAEALFLTNMLALRQGERADPFLPGDRLAGLR